MKRLLAIGEALIDFIPRETDCSIKDVISFMPKVGGAPANVCGAYCKLGGRAAIITKLGNDPFGDKIIRELTSCGLDVSHILRTDEANTSLAFVALKSDGDREFSFYRKPGADMLLSPEEIREEWFEDAAILHFCSVDLTPSPMKEAHRKAIEIARKKDMLISFDPNLRFPLWDSKEALRETVLEFMPFSDIVKLSIEEMEFLTGRSDPLDALPLLLKGETSLILITLGKDGASCYTKDLSLTVPGEKVDAVDTTGAGDGFIGSFLYCLSRDGVSKKRLNELDSQTLLGYLRFSDLFCAKSITRKGAIASYPTLDELRHDQ